MRRWLRTSASMGRGSRGTPSAHPQADIDACALHLFGLARHQAEWLLDSFTVLRKYEERDHQESRTKRLLLAAYDAIAEGVGNGRAYVSPLEPKPGWWRRGQAAFSR